MRRAVSCAALLSLWLAFPACAAEPAADPSEAGALTSEDDKTLYAMGLAIAQNLGQYQLTEEELKVLQQGLADGILGREHKVNLSEYGPKIQPFAQSRAQAAAAEEREEGDAFLAEAAAGEGAQQTESGLIYTEITAGDGPSPGPTDTVTVHYHGTLRDGTVFDSSVERGEPTSFPLNRVVPCWTEALQMMQVGGKARIVCPPDLAYGDRQAGQIPPGSTLIFEVELLGIQEAEGQGDAGQGGGDG